MEYRDRQEAFPDEIGATLSAFLGSLHKEHHAFILDEAQFVKYVSGLGNIIQKLEAGAIGVEQTLTLMQELPLIEYCDDEGYGLDDSEIEMNMRVSASTTKKEDTHEDVDSDTSIEASTGFGPFAHGKVKQHIHGHLSHGAEQANEADYSAYTKLKVRLKRIKPPPARRMTSMLLQEYIQTLHFLLKEQMKKQSAALHQEVSDKEPPKRLPEEKKKNGSDAGEKPPWEQGGQEAA